LVFRVDGPSSVKLIGLQSLPAVTYMTDTLKKNILTKKYINVFMSLSLSDQRSLLGRYSPEVLESLENGSLSPKKAPRIQIDILLPSATGIRYCIQPVVTTWNAYTIISNIVEKLADDGILTEIPAAYMNVINATLTIATQQENTVFTNNNNSESDILDGRWVGIWNTIKNTVFANLNNVDIVESSIGIMNSYITCCPTVTSIVMNDDAFIMAMKGMYGVNANATTQKVFENFLRELYNRNGIYSEIATEFLADFAKNSSSLFEKSVTLQKLLKDLR
jgi:hypothetical protein